MCVCTVVVLLTVSFLALNTEVHKIFDEMLTRKAEADKIRKQLRILNNYQHIFSMPARIKKNIDQVNIYNIYNNENYTGPQILSRLFVDTLLQP